MKEAADTYSNKENVSAPGLLGHDNIRDGGYAADLEEGAVHGSKGISIPSFPFEQLNFRADQGQSSDPLLHLIGADEVAKGKRGHEAFRRYIEKSGGRVIGENLRFVVIDKSGNEITKNGKPFIGEMDFLTFYDKYWANEVKNGDSANLTTRQKELWPHVKGGNIKFIDENSRRAGIEGKFSMTNNGRKWGGFVPNAGPDEARRFLRQYFRIAFPPVRGGVE